MKTTSGAGSPAIEQIAQRHGFSVEATRHMLDAVRRGNGSMAQFGHAEFAGSGQWMRDGMTMVSDLFNHDLKRRVAALCEELAGVVSGEARPADRPSPGAATTAGAGAGDGSLSTASAASSSGPSSGVSAAPPASSSSTSADWWPGNLGRPNGTGAQNDMRYAWFADARRLVIRRGGEVAVYDTQDHRISGVSQQQGGADSVSFSSQHGPVSLDSLPRVDASAAAPPVLPGPRTTRMTNTANTAGSAVDSPAAASSGGDPMAMIERLATLRDKGVLSAEEFNAKKAELLGRL